MTGIRLDEMSMERISQLFASDHHLYGLLLPVGCTEQHGSDLPLGCDTAIARGAAENLARNLNDHDKYRALVMPDLAYTPSPGAEYTPGTVSVSFDLLGSSLAEVVSAALRTPWKFVGIVNGHAHNHGRVIECSVAGSAGTLGTKVPIPVLNVYEFSNIATNFGLNTGSHAGEFELALYRYYSGRQPIETALSDWVIPKPRPKNIFGLNIIDRSCRGVISDARPNVSRAMAVAADLGREIDSKLFTSMVDNLDNYFQYWS